MKMNGMVSNPMLLFAFLLSALTGSVKQTAQFIELYFINARKRKGGVMGGGRGGAIQNAKDGLLLFVFFAIMIVILLVLSGSTTGSAGIFGNVTVGFQGRQAANVLAQFFTVVGLLIIIVIIGSLV